jgi:hypothetical protein
MDPLSPPLGFLVLLSSGWINRQQQARQQLNAGRSEHAPADVSFNGYGQGAIRR